MHHHGRRAHRQLYVLRAPITGGDTQLYTAETLDIIGNEGRAANKLKAPAKTGNKRRLKSTLILSSDLPSDSLLNSFAAGSGPVRQSK